MVKFKKKNIINTQNFNMILIKFKNFFKKKKKEKNVIILLKIKIIGHIFKFKYKTNKKLIKFNIGTSHKNYLFVKKNVKHFLIKKLKKNKILFIQKSKTKILQKLKNELNLLQKKRPKNLYTKKGIHLSNKKFKKKVGKKSTYI